MDSNHFPGKDIDFPELLAFANKAGKDISKKLSFYKQITDVLKPALFVYDIIKFRMLWNNLHIGLQLGYSENEVQKFQPEWVYKHLHPDDVGLYNRSIDFFRNNEGETYSTLVRVKHKDGNWVWVYVCFSVFDYDEEGQVTQILGMGINFSTEMLASKHIKEFYMENCQQDNHILLHQLSGREREILKLIAQGLTCKEISNALQISVHTANNHRKHLLQKLSLHNIAELSHFAVENGIA